MLHLVYIKCDFPYIYGEENLPSTGVAKTKPAYAAIRSDILMSCIMKNIGAFG
jgi:hypothetical protein